MSALPSVQLEQRDSIGIGRLVEGQMRAVIQLIKDRGLLNEPPPEESEGRGIVVSAGGKYAEWGLVNARWIREKGIGLPVQVWHMGEREIPRWMRPHFSKLEVELVDAFEVRKKHGHRRLAGWSIKQYAAMRCPWREVVSLDADAFVLRHPDFVLDDPAFQQRGAFFVADVNRCRKSDWAYFYAGIPVPNLEMESGFFAWDRVKAWPGIRMTHWIAEHSEVWDRLIWGDKDRPALGFGATGTPYLFADQPRWMGYGIRHSWNGEAICDHGMAFKRQEHAAPDPLIPALFEWVRSLK